MVIFSVERVHTSHNVIIAEVHVILVDNVMVSHHKLKKRKCLKVV